MKKNFIALLALPALLLTACHKPVASVLPSGTSTTPPSSSSGGSPIGPELASETTRLPIAPGEKVSAASDPLATALKALTLLEATNGITIEQTFATASPALPFFSAQRITKTADASLYQEATLANLGSDYGRRLNLYRHSSGYSVYARPSKRQLSIGGLQDGSALNEQRPGDSELFATDDSDIESLLGGADEFIDFFPINSYTVNSASLSYLSQSRSYQLAVESTDPAILSHLLERYGLGQLDLSSLALKTRIEYELSEDFTISSIEYAVGSPSSAYLTSQVAVKKGAVIEGESDYQAAQNNQSADSGVLAALETDLETLSLSSFMALIATPYPVTIPLLLEGKSPLGDFRLNGNLEYKSLLTSLDLIGIMNLVQQGQIGDAIIKLLNKTTLNFELAVEVRAAQAVQPSLVAEMKLSVFDGLVGGQLIRGTEVRDFTFIVDELFDSFKPLARNRSTTSGGTTVPEPPLTFVPADLLEVLTKDFWQAAGNVGASHSYIDLADINSLITSEQIVRTTAGDSLSGLKIDGTSDELADRYLRFANGNSLTDDILVRIAEASIDGPADKKQQLLTLLGAIDFTKLKYQLDFQCQDGGLLRYFDLSVSLPSAAGSFDLHMRVGDLGLLDRIEAGKYYPTAK